MLEGKCPKCGYHCIGWALRFPRNQSCPNCGTGFEITQDGKVFTGYSPFTAEKYFVNIPNNEPLSNEENKVISKENGQEYR